MDPATMMQCGVVVVAVVAVVIAFRLGLYQVPAFTEGAGDARPVLVAAVGVLLIAQLAGGVAWTMLAPGAHVPKSDAAFLAARTIGLLVSGGVSLALGYFAWRRLAAPSNRASRASAGDAALGGLALAMVAAPMLITVSMLSAMAHHLYTGKTPDPLAHTLLQLIQQHRSSPYVLLILFSAGVLAPMAEEVVYRGLIQTGLTRVLTPAGGQAWPALLITAIVFAIVHIPVVPAQALPTLFVLALFLGLARARTGGLVAPILIHMLFNLANLAAVWFMPPQP